MRGAASRELAYTIFGDCGAARLADHAAQETPRPGKTRNPQGPAHHPDARGPGLTSRTALVPTIQRQHTDDTSPRHGE